MFRPFTGEKTSFYTHFNGERPYHVTYANKQVGVLMKTPYKNAYTSLVTWKNVEEFFVGDQNPETSIFTEMPRYRKNLKALAELIHGNTCLFRVERDSETFQAEVQRKNSTEGKAFDTTKSFHYVYIDGRIVQFSTPEKITLFTSELGNNDVPYPLAQSENYIYVLFENCLCLPKTLFPKGMIDDVQRFQVEASGFFYREKLAKRGESFNFKQLHNYSDEYPQTSGGEDSEGERD